MTTIKAEKIPPWEPVSNVVLEQWAFRARHHGIKATEASHVWEDRKAELKRYIKDNAGNYDTAKKIRDKFELDWELNDAMSDWSWNEREQSRLNLAILGEKAMREMMRDTPAGPGRPFDAE